VINAELFLQYKNVYKFGIEIQTGETVLISRTDIIH